MRCNNDGRVILRLTKMNVDMLMADQIYDILKTSIGNKSLKDLKLRNLHYPEYRHAKIEIITKTVFLII